MDVHPLFSTPVAVAQIPDFDAIDRELAERLLVEEQSSPGVVRSNVGGWHSAPDLSLRTEPCYRAVIEMVVAQVGRLVAALAQEARLTLPAYRHVVQAWAMIMRAGDHAVVHHHGDAHWSAVYYVDAGDADPALAESGALVLVDPRRGGRPLPGLDLFSAISSITPRTSSLVLFPGWLQHYVHPYRGRRPRISISCNLVMDVEVAPR